jgi:hypothetical protein
VPLKEITRSVIFLSATIITGWLKIKAKEKENAKKHATETGFEPARPKPKHIVISSASP